MIVIVAVFDFPTAEQAHVLEIVREMDERTQAEPGCRHYKHALSVSDESRLVLSEVWEDADALEAHFASAHFAAFRAAANELGLKPKVEQFDATETPPDSDRYWRKRLRRALNS